MKIIVKKTNNWTIEDWRTYTHSFNEVFRNLCFKCSNLEKGFHSMKKQGLISLIPPQPGEAFENEDIAFLLTKFGFSIELIDTTKKTGLLNGGY